MAVPQRRISKTRKRKRRTHFKLHPVGMVVCKHCGEMIQPHKVCPHCGYYNGKLVGKVKNKQVEKSNDKKPTKKAKKEEKKEAKK